MKFFEMEEGKEYYCFYGSGTKSDFKHRINYGFVEYLRLNKELDNIWVRDSSSHIELYNCDFEEIEREIDWEKVPRGTMVRVGDLKEDVWRERKFVCKLPLSFICITKDGEGVNSWACCEIIGEIKEEWYK